MARISKQRLRRRYSVGEWYGRSFEVLTPAERFSMARKEVDLEGVTGMDCPFRAPRKCNKKGGVCSLRAYEQIGDGPIKGVGPLVTTCPNRFLESGAIFRWVGEVVLQTTDPIVLSEIGFLDRLRPEEEREDDPESRDFIGRIDNVLVHPTKTPLDWCALELQAVYFSGKSMTNEFSMLSEREFPELPYPSRHRRPDWRSSGPKRLLPQLQTKVPTIARWGKRLSIIIDEAFFGSLVGLEREKHISNAEIAWFVVGYEQVSAGWKLTPGEVVLTKLETSVKALTGGVPLSQPEFERQLRIKLGLAKPSHPLAISRDVNP